MERDSRQRSTRVWAGCCALLAPHACIALLHFLHVVSLVELAEGLDTRSPQFAARGLTLSVRCTGGDGKEEQQLTVARTPLRMTGLQDNTKPAPLLGGDNAALLRAKL